jgi:hypothetical protein
LIVKNWSAALPKLGFLDPIADELSGVEGQNHPNPQSLFYDHAIVVAFGKIYDPSYGTPECNSYASWEEMSLEGYGGMVRILDPLGGNSGDYLWVQPSIQHGTFSDSGY